MSNVDSSMRIEVLVSIVIKCGRRGLGMVTLLAFSLTGCSLRSRKVESKLVDRIGHCPNMETCVVEISEGTTFDWDRAYTFKYNACRAEREQAIGLPDAHFKELMRQMVVTKLGRVVYEESEPTNVEHPIKDEVIFDIPDGKSYQAYYRNTRFRVSKQDSEWGAYYLLKQTP